MMDVQGMIDVAEKQARQMLVGTKDELLPLWLVETETDGGIIFGTPFRGPEQKRLVVEAVRGLMRQYKALAYSFLCETWIATAQTREELDGLPPSERPDRKEAVMALAEVRGGAQTIRLWEIKRGEGGACVDLVAMEPMEHMESLTFGDMFDKETMQ